MRISLIIFCMGLLFTSQTQNFITPSVITTLPESLNETSGLVNLNGEIWTHTDNGGETELYQINLTNGSIIRTVNVHEANNIDWEDIASDETYVYIGDFGNNDGSRTNLKVYRVSRSDIASSNDVDAEKIHFSYSDQTSFEPNYHYTNFDCEALACYQDKLYLFSKNWIDNQTKVYELPKMPGTYVAQLQAAFNVNCLITGAEITPAGNELLLIGYNTSGGSYTWIFQDYPGVDFFSGSNTKLIWTLLTQIEGICFASDHEAYVSSEKFTGTLDPTLFYLDLSNYMTQIDVNMSPLLSIYSESGLIKITSGNGMSLTGELQIVDLMGNVLIEKDFHNETSINIPLSCSTGIYLLLLSSGQSVIEKKILIIH